MHCGRFSNSRWVNVPSQPEGGTPRLSSRPVSTTLVGRQQQARERPGKANRRASHPSPSPRAAVPLPSSPTPSNSSVSSQDTLSVTRETMVKGVIIKGIVCTPKTNPKSKGHRKPQPSKSSNPFEKRAAPQPPAVVTDGVPKTKSKSKKDAQSGKVKVSA